MEISQWEKQDISLDIDLYTNKTFYFFLKHLSGPES